MHDDISHYTGGAGICRSILAVLVICLVMSALAGCGPVTVSLFSFSGLEGYVECYQVSSLGYSKTLGISATEEPAGLYYNSSDQSYHNYKLLLSFSLSSLAGAQVQSARLKIYLKSLVNTPFADTAMGNVLVDAVCYNSGTANDSLYGFGALDSAVHAVDDPITGGAAGTWQIVDVTEAVQDMIDPGRTYA